MNISFIVLFLFCVNKVTSEKSKYNLTWLAAQNYCRTRGMVSRFGKSSLAEQSSERYWTRRYTKRSDWIHILGCYDQDTVLHYVQSNLTILDTTIVKCHGICLKDWEIFGIQGNSCFCLSKLDAKIQRLHKNKCNWPGDKFRGDSNSLAIFRTTDFNAIQPRKNDATNHENLCVQIICDNQEKFTMTGCKSFGNALCSKTVLEGNYTWEKAMQECVQQSTSADYLKADIDIDSTSSNICTNYSISPGGSLWLGIWSFSSELEYQDDNDLTNLTMDMKCQSCVDVCILEDCNELRLAFCEPVSELETTGKHDRTSQYNTDSMTSDQKIYSYTSTIAYERSSSMSTNAFYSSVSHKDKYASRYTPSTYVSMKITTQGFSTIQEISNGSDNITHTAVVYGVPLALAIIILVVCLLYCRRKHHKKRNLDAVSPAECKQSSSHAQVKITLYELADNSKLEKPTSDSDTPETENQPNTGESEMYEKVNSINVSETEDVYNHLRERSDSIEQSENIYDRSTKTYDIENPLYDITTNSAHQKASLDPKYDHAVSLDKLKE